MPDSSSPDILIIGSGMGGGTLARALAGSAARVLVIERGDYLPREAENWSADAVFGENRYKAPETWLDRDGRSYKPGVHYFVGGNTKLYGAALPRLRVADFEDLEHEGGTSPGWPISYEQLEPYYAVAERWYRVHGRRHEDPTEPWRSSDYPFPAMPDDPYMADLRARFMRTGLRPFSLPIGVDYRDGGACIRCRNCDAFPCQLGAKSDAETCGITPALAADNVTLWTGTRALRLLPSPDGRSIVGVEVERKGTREILTAGTYVVSCGAVNSAALLLRSGVANQSGQVGRNYMVHNNAVLIAVHPTRRNDTVFQKSFAINDFYFRGPDFPYPMGNIQPVGKVQAPMLSGALPRVPRALLGTVAARSSDWWVMSEDLPHPDNRVVVAPDGSIQILWTPNNTVAHVRLLETMKRVMSDAGFPVVLHRTMGIETNSHQVGTVRFGHDPATSVLDPLCRTHDHDNLYVVDGSFFPSSAAMNPALTVAAQAIRVGEHLRGEKIATV